MADAESRSIQSLASRLRLARDSDDAYVLILGAGASLSSNVPSTDDIIKSLLEEYGQDLEGSTLDRFDLLWNSADEDRRHRYLEPFLNDPDRAPSPGYMHLAELIKEGFFQLVISFNFDVLLQKALELSNADGLLELVADYDPVDQIEKQIERERSKPKIYQLHGSLRRPSTLKFSADDVFDYPEEVEEIITRQTAKNVIVCGYRFEDLNLIKAFADFGKELWWVNPEQPPRYFKVAQRKRKSEDFAVTADAGRFDEFFAQLHSTLMRPKQASSEKDDSVRFNPFKFLASHREVDARFLFYRRRSIRKLYEAIDQHRPRSLHFAGKRMVGKTSLIRAGLLPLINANDSFEPIYIRRCGINLTERLATKIRRVTGKQLAGDSVEEILESVTQEYAGKHVVLILDQFDNSIIAMGRMERAAAKKTLDALFKKPFDNLTVVAVIADDVHFGEDLYVGFANDSENGYISNNMYQQLQPLTKHQVGRILKFQARRADAGIPEALLERLVAQYDARRFTLAHIETICHLLVARINEDRRVVEQDLEAGSRLVTALNAALLEHDILSYLEDLPVPEEQNLLRNVLLAASNTSRKDIAEYLKDNFARMHVDQIWTPDSKPGRGH